MSKGGGMKIKCNQTFLSVTLLTRSALLFSLCFWGELTPAPYRPSSKLSPVVVRCFHLVAAPFVHTHLPAGHLHRLGFSPHVGLSWWRKNIPSQESCWLKQMMSWKNPIPLSHRGDASYWKYTLFKALCYFSTPKTYAGIYNAKHIESTSVLDFSYVHWECIICMSALA